MFTNRGKTTGVKQLTTREGVIVSSSNDLMRDRISLAELSSGDFWGCMNPAVDRAMAQVGQTLFYISPCPFSFDELYYESRLTFIHTSVPYLSRLNVLFIDVELYFTRPAGIPTSSHFGGDGPPLIITNIPPVWTI